MAIVYLLGTVTSTDKSLKHSKSKDIFIIANVSNYFEKHSGRDSSSYIPQTGQSKGGKQKNRFLSMKGLRETGTLSSPQRSKLGQYKPMDDFDDVVIRNNVQEFYTPTAISFWPLIISYQSWKLAQCQLSIKIKINKKQYHNSKNT